MPADDLERKYAHLDRADLLKLLSVYAHNWLAHDGCWFLAAEERYGLETAIELDIESWRRFTIAEAKRIMKEFAIAPGGAKGCPIFPASRSVWSNTPGSPRRSTSGSNPSAFSAHPTISVRAIAGGVSPYGRRSRRCERKRAG